MSFDRAGKGQPLSQWRPNPDGDGGWWTYSCPTCFDTGWLVEHEKSPPGLGYDRHAVGKRCECQVNNGPRHERPDVSANWEWLRNNGRLMFRLKGDRTYWIRDTGELVVYDWQTDRFTSYPEDHALSAMYADVYTRRSTRRYIPGS